MTDTPLCDSVWDRLIADNEDLSRRLERADKLLERVVSPQVSTTDDDDLISRIEHHLSDQ